MIKTGSVSINGGSPLFAARGVRDPENPCEAFDPRDDGQRVVEQDLGFSLCETDGHYLCGECTNISVAALRNRQGRCEDCGETVTRDLLGFERCPAGCF